jgi:preprotein translocase subunit SecG
LAVIANTRAGGGSPFDRIPVAAPAQPAQPAAPAAPAGPSAPLAR